VAGAGSSINVVNNAKIKAAGIPLDTRFDSWTPMFRASYDWTDDLMTYVTWAKGYRAGGYGNRIDASRLETARPFKDETVYSWESGVKSQFWDNRVQLNVSGYYNQYDNQQITSFLPGVGVVTQIQNAGKSRIRGWETELLMQPLEGLRIQLAQTWVEVDYIEFGQPSRGRTCLTGRRCVGAAPNLIPVIDSKAAGIHVPKRKYSGIVEYSFPEQSWGALSVTGAFVREGPKEWLDTKVQNTFTRSNHYTKYDARIALDDAFGREGLSLAVVGKNLTDRVYRCCQGIDFGVWQGTPFGDPREVWFEIGYEFGDGI
jgi:iron complex outermembrane receptor protein